MRKLAIFTTLLFALSAPAHAGQQERAMVSGAATGAAIGAAIGSNSGETAKGALVGAFFGTIAGALLGDVHRPQSRSVYTSHRYRRVETPVYRHRPPTRVHEYGRYRKIERREDREYARYERHVRAQRSPYEVSRMDRRLPERHRLRKAERYHERQRD